MEQNDGSRTDFADEQAGYKRALRPRQVQMIAIGGAIGTGLFMGAGGRLAGAGPSLFGVYVVCGAVAFLIVRALGGLLGSEFGEGALRIPLVPGLEQVGRAEDRWGDALGAHGYSKSARLVAHLRQGANRSTKTLNSAD